MSGRQFRRGALSGVFAATLIVAGCGDSNPSGIPYISLGRDLAGVYNASTVPAELNMRLVLGTRRTVTGRYTHPAGGEVRFIGTWEREGSTLYVMLPGQEGMPPEIVFDIRREEILTEIPRGDNPFDTTPENAPPNFLRQDIMRLTGSAVVAGVPVDLNLVRVITDVVGGGGGETQT